MKQDWINSIAHLNAQSAGIFFLSMIALIAAVIIIDIRKENDKN
jgi:hypothetical protein